jgi:ribosomal protein S18 acetylase RimI-like enzyme
MHLLDNPIWSALTTRQAHFAQSFGPMKRFPPDVSPLGGFEKLDDEAIDALRALLAADGTAGLFMPARIDVPAGLEIMIEGALLQMVMDDDAKLPAIERPHDFVELGDADVPEMLALTALTKPGPFVTRTREMGTYLGIRKGGKLVAMAGERLKLPGYTEISAVCTHPDHLGNGYAGFLMTILAQQIRARGEVPILHTLPGNTRAVHLYDRLGFKNRLFQHFAVFRAVSKSSAQAAPSVPK